jgi:CheY-like chemotaxis protein/cell division septation protein DedD
MASKTVLVIDADSETEQLIASTLESEGYLVFSVPGGDVGAEMAQKVSPSLIFINPDETGLDACRTIHGFESLKKVPIILLASSSRAIDRAVTSACGVSDFLEVPFSPEELIEKTARTLDVKAPIVLHVKEKGPLHDIGGLDIAAETEEGPVATESVVGGADSEDISEMAELDEEISTEGESNKIEAPDYTPDYSYEDDSPGKETSPRKKNNRSVMAAAVIIIVIAGTAGFLFYSGLIPGIGPKKTVPVTTPNTAEKPKTVVPAPAAQTPAPSNENQKEPSGEDNKPVAVPQQTATSASPTPTPSQHASSASAPAVNSPGKKVYSVQLGVFKSENNAAALTKQFTEKGYDAFMIKSAGKDMGTLYRVLVGKSEDRKVAAKLAAKIRGKEKIKPVIYSE